MWISRMEPAAFDYGLRGLRDRARICRKQSSSFSRRKVTTSGEPNKVPRILKAVQLAPTAEDFDRGGDPEQSKLECSLSYPLR